MKNDIRSVPLVRPDQLRPHPHNRPQAVHMANGSKIVVIDGQARARELRRQNRMAGLDEIERDARDIFG